MDDYYDDVTLIPTKYGHTCAPVDPDDRARMQECARHLLAAITAVRDATNGVALSNAVNDFSAGIQPLLEAVFDCGDFGLPSLWAVDDHLVRYAAGKEDDLPDFTELERVLGELRDNVDAFETDDEREQRRRDGRLTRDEFEWAQECEETERGLNAQFARDAALDCNWRTYDF